MGFSPPGSTALQVIFQPVIVSEPLRLSVLNKRLTTLLVLLRAAGKELPQLFSIKVVPSPSVIVRWSQSQVESHHSMSNAVNCNEMISPSSTCIVSVFSR